MDGDQITHSRDAGARGNIYKFMRVHTLNKLGQNPPTGPPVQCFHGVVFPPISLVWLKFRNPECHGIGNPATATFHRKGDILCAFGLHSRPGGTTNGPHFYIGDCLHQHVHSPRYFHGEAVCARHPMCLCKRGPSCCTSWWKLCPSWPRKQMRLCC